MTPSSMSSVQSSARLSDRIRQAINLIAAPLMWVLSSLSFFDPKARSPEGLSDINQSLLVPLGFAFSIWFPIFVGCITYGILQAMNANRTRGIYRDIGWWTGAGFLLICGWSLISAYAPQDKAQIGTALIFILAVLCLVKAMLTLSARQTDLENMERLCVYLPIGLIAGWSSLAVFLNWTPIFMSATEGQLSGLASNIIILILALSWAAFIIRKSGGNRAYAFPIIWGLFFVAVKQLVTVKEASIIGVLAVIGILVLIALTVYKPKIPIRS